jgi:hypothetical protein
MNTLMIMFLFVTLQPKLACGQPGMLPGLSRQMVVTPANRADSFALVANRSMIASPADSGSVRETDTVDADLGYYLDLHTQALSESDGPSMKPWIELQPVGASEGAAPAVIQAPGSAEPSAAGSDQFGKLPLPRSRHACS